MIITAHLLSACSKNPFVSGKAEIVAEPTEEEWVEARKKAAKEFLNLELKYSEEAVNSLNIITANSSKKEESNILYIEFEEEEATKATFRRAAMVKNDNIKLVNYIPPQGFERFAKLEELSSAARKEDTKLKSWI